MGGPVTVALSVARIRLSLRRDSKHLAADVHALPLVHAMCPEGGGANGGGTRGASLPSPCSSPRLTPLPLRGAPASRMRRSAAMRTVEEFYDRFGWRVRTGQTGDAQLFWPSDAGPIRAAMEQQRQARARSALSEAGTRLSLLEAGCGGNPAASLLPLCARYTGVDFSEAGLDWHARSSARRTCPSTSEEPTSARCRFPTTHSTRATRLTSSTTSTISPLRRRRSVRCAGWSARGAVSCSSWPIRDPCCFR